MNQQQSAVGYLPEERPGFVKLLLYAIQQVIVMFPATVTVALVTGFQVSTTIFASGLATLCFILITGKKIPLYYGSSFAYLTAISSMCAAEGFEKVDGILPTEAIQYAQFGIICSGLVLSLIHISHQEAGNPGLSLPGNQPERPPPEQPVPHRKGAGAGAGDPLVYGPVGVHHHGRPHQPGVCHPLGAAHQNDRPKPEVTRPYKAKKDTQANRLRVFLLFGRSEQHPSVLEPQPLEGGQVRLQQGGQIGPLLLESVQLLGGEGVLAEAGL